MSQSEIERRLSHEADLCRNEGAEDIAALLDDATAAIAELREQQAASVVLVFHPDDPALKLLPDGTHVILQRKLPKG
jgi:hypothetical protein